jgi:hypothetical protein
VTLSHVTLEAFQDHICRVSQSAEPPTPAPTHDGAAAAGQWRRGSGGGQWRLAGQRRDSGGAAAQQRCGAAELVTCMASDDQEADIGQMGARVQRTSAVACATG